MTRSRTAGSTAESRAPAVSGSGRPSSAERFAARSSRSWWHPRLFLASLGLFVLAVLSAWAVFSSSLFGVASVSVEGVPASAAAGVRERAAVPMGEPLARVDTSAVAARVLLPDVAAVSVRREWPRTVVVQVTPRVAVVAVKNPQGQLEVVDRFGIPYALVDAAPTGVPVLASTARVPSAGAVASLSTVLQELPSDQRRRLTKLAVSPAGLVTFSLGKIDVAWGDGSDSALKEQVLKALLPQAKSHIDVSAPRSPSAR